MPIQGAIFDCDGTLLDSMPMWTTTCVALLERYGVQDAQRVFEEHESLDMDKKCYWYHDHLGIGESGEALFRELWTMVEEAYRTYVQPFEGCASFLQTLKAARVPMLIASATPTALLRIALSAHGLLDYFDGVVFAGDVGRGKEFPDVYLAAQKRLGTEREQTWVFEDAPFGIRSAARVGFPVAAILNDHDGRDEAFVEKWATVVARGYEGLDVQTFEQSPHIMDALVVAGSPEPSAPELVAQLSRETDFVVAADAGANVLADAHVAPDVLCGDEDSLAEEAREWIRQQETRVLRYPVDKDDTDLGLSIACAHEEAERQGACLRLHVTCASGGRPDHALAVWGLLAHNASLAPRLVEDGFECRILSPTGTSSWVPRVRVGQTISLVALSTDVVVSAQGMRWPLDHYRLELLSDRGVSNRATSEDCRITCHQGVLAAFVLR